MDINLYFMIISLSNVSDYLHNNGIIYRDVKVLQQNTVTIETFLYYSYVILEMVCYLLSVDL